MGTNIELSPKYIVSKKKKVESNGHSVLSRVKNMCVCGRFVASEKICKKLVRVAASDVEIDGWETIVEGRFTFHYITFYILKHFPSDIYVLLFKILLK